MQVPHSWVIHVQVRSWGESASGIDAVASAKGGCGFAIVGQNRQRVMLGQAGAETLLQTRRILNQLLLMTQAAMAAFYESSAAQGGLLQAYQLALCFVRCALGSSKLASPSRWHASRSERGGWPRT